MRINQLYTPEGPLWGKDVFIVGTGPSMTVMPLDYLAGEACVLLNDATRLFPTLGPVAMANNRKFLKGSSVPFQCVKGRLRFDPNPERDDNHVSWNDPQFYVYSYREPPWDKDSHHDIGTLWKEPCYFWSPHQGSISAFAIQFACWAGARSITLVGCDCAAIGEAEYVDGKSTKRKVFHAYEQYSRGILDLIPRVRERWGVPVVSCTPFAGLGREAEQLEEMRRWPK